MNRPIRIFSLTPAGNALGEKLYRQLTISHSADVQHHASAKPFAATLQQSFIDGAGLILICATGIAVRTLAPVLNNKKIDPPVLVLDDAGQFVIPLLSGHEGGANQWAESIARSLNAQLVMTTARDYLSPVYSVGMGCERGCPENHLYELLLSTVETAGLTLVDISSISSIDIKADEVGLQQLAARLKLPYQTYSKQQLLTVDHLLSTRSEYVFNTVGVYGVAESAALYAVNDLNEAAPELVQPKLKTNKATCAIARQFRDGRVIKQKSS
ncbi:MAG: cobalamin biosynthesis protein [Reinekea sp.]